MISPRAEEKAAIAAVLASDKYESAEDMAPALIKALVTELEKRPMMYLVAVGLPPEGPWLPVGPFWTWNAAEAWGLRHPELVRRIYPMPGPARFDKKEYVPNGDCECGHHPSQHDPKMGCCVLYTTPKKKQCPCGRFVARKEAA